jgi:hypothetical protein
MTDVWALVDIEAEALGTSVGLLDALVDFGTAGATFQPGRHADDLRRLGDHIARAAADMSIVVAEYEARTGRRLAVA